MASDKFGNQAVQPLYNATGRNPRDLEMGSIGKGLGSVGSSGAGNKDFGTPTQPAKSKEGFLHNMLDPYARYSPLNPYNRFNQPGGKQRRKRGGGAGGGGGAAEADDMDNVVTPTEGGINFNPTMFDQSQFKGASGNIKVGGSMGTGGSVVGNTSDSSQNLNVAVTPGSSTPIQKQASPLKGRTMTAEQKANRDAKKAANPALGKKNMNRPPRTASPIARQKSAPKTAAGLGNIAISMSRGGNL